MLPIVMPRPTWTGFTPPLFGVGATPLEIV